MGSTCAVAILQEVLVTIGDVAQQVVLLFDPDARADGLHDGRAVDDVGVHQLCHLPVVLPRVRRVQRIPLAHQLNTQACGTVSSEPAFMQCLCSLHALKSLLYVSIEQHTICFRAAQDKHSTCIQPRHPTHLPLSPDSE